MIHLIRIFLFSLLLVSCSKKVKYIDKEVNVNIVPLPKEVDLIESNKHILLPKKIKVFIDSNEKKNLFDLIFQLLLEYREKVQNDLIHH